MNYIPNLRKPILDLNKTKYLNVIKARLYNGITDFILCYEHNIEKNEYYFLKK